MLVENIVGTGNRRCYCGSWRNHWEAFSGARGDPRHCAAYDCDNSPDVGAHVRGVGGSDRRHFIVLLCFSCNTRTGPFELVPFARLAPANIRETCGAE